MEHHYQQQSQDSLQAMSMHFKLWLLTQLGMVHILISTCSLLLMFLHNLLTFKLTLMIILRSVSLGNNLWAMEVNLFLDFMFTGSNVLTLPQSILWLQQLWLHNSHILTQPSLEVYYIAITLMLIILLVEFQMIQFIFKLHL